MKALDEVRQEFETERNMLKIALEEQAADLDG